MFMVVRTPCHSPLLIKGTSKRGKVRKNFELFLRGPGWDWNLGRNPLTYIRNIQKGEKEKKSWYQYVFLKSPGRTRPQRKCEE
jgi:hypothetical protein